MAGDDRVAWRIKPYHLGFAIWDRIVEREGIEKARKVLEYLHRVWRRPLTLHTVDAGGAETVLSVGNAAR